MSLDALRQLVDAWHPPSIVPAQAVEILDHAVYGYAIKADTERGPLFLLPLFPAGILKPTEVGGLGLALLGADANEGFWLGGRAAAGLLGDWEGETWRIKADGHVLELAGDEVIIQDGTKGAARKDDAVSIQITQTDAPGIIALATALLTTGLFVPNAAPPPVPPVAIPSPINFSGVITEGSNSVKVGD